MDEITSLERDVMKKLLEGDDPAMAALREQFRSATLVSREFTGVGFFSDFAVAPELRLRLLPHDFAISDVYAEMDDLPNGAGFVLFVAGGVMRTLEGYTFNDPWPDEVRNVKLSYFASPRKNPLNTKKSRSVTSGRRRGGQIGRRRRFLGRLR